MSMKVERSSLDQVKKRFDFNKRKLEEKKKEYDIDQRLQELKEEVRFYTSNTWCLVRCVMDISLVSG